MHEISYRVEKGNFCCDFLTPPQNVKSREAAWRSRLPTRPPRNCSLLFVSYVEIPDSPTDAYGEFSVPRSGAPTTIAPKSESEAGRYFCISRRERPTELSLCLFRAAKVAGSGSCYLTFIVEIGIDSSDSLIGVHVQQFLHFKGCHIYAHEKGPEFKRTSARCCRGEGIFCSPIAIALYDLNAYHLLIRVKQIE